MAIQTLYSAKQIEQQFHSLTGNGQNLSRITLWNVIAKTLDNMKYSIIYAVIRPKISERISLGLIFVDGDKVDVRYASMFLRRCFDSASNHLAFTYTLQHGNSIGEARVNHSP